MLKFRKTDPFKKRDCKGNTIFQNHNSFHSKLIKYYQSINFRTYFRKRSLPPIQFLSLISNNQKLVSSTQLTILHIFTHKFFTMQIIQATRSDMPILFQFVNDLAIFEKAPEEVITSPELYAQLWEQGLFESFLCYELDVPVGMAMYYYGLSTWKGKFLYLEDFYIRPEHRGKGYGELAFRHLISLAKEKECTHIRWQVLDWNTDAIRFYERMGASVEGGWLNGRLYI